MLIVINIKRRNKYHTPCLDDKKYDDTILKEMLRAVNYSPPYWKFKVTSTFPICSSKSQLKNLSSHFHEAMMNGRNEEISPPCTEIQSISRDISERDLEIDEDSNG